jgi:hypothetical protein
MEKGAIGCHGFIRANAGIPLGLKVILGALLDRSSQAANEKKTKSLMYHVQMFGVIAK